MRRWAPSFSDILKTVAHQLERQMRWLRAATKRLVGIRPPVRILPYRGYGNSDRLLLMGRVVEDRPVGIPQEDDSWWQNVRAMYRRFVVAEIPGVRVRATVSGQSVEMTTDRFGYFRGDLKLSDSLSQSSSWVPVEFELLDQVCPDQPQVKVFGGALTPPASSRFGIISDVDDTVIYSNATDFVRMARITFVNNVHTRTPLPGVARFYRALERSGEDESPNPLFYVSSSAWNLYDLIEDFLDLHDIPAGPILMRDLRLDDTKFIKSGHEHKLEKIENLMGLYSELPFVLIGDAGQDDPVIYQEAVRQRPDQVLAIYIRAVGSERRNERVRKMVRESTEHDVPMLLVEDVEEAIQHAKAIGLIKATTHA